MTNMMRMVRAVRLLLSFEAVNFLAAASVHFGFAMKGYEHQQAGVAESVIGIALLAGLGVTWVDRAWTRRIGLAAQAFALLGTLVGVFTIAVGIGPRTTPDVAYHVAIVAVLLSGIIVVARTPSSAR